MTYINKHEIYKLVNFDKFNENNFGLEKHEIFALSFDKNIILIIKFTNYKKVKQESNLIQFVNSIYNNFFAKIIYVNICEKIPFYVMEYIIGKPVLLKLQDASFYNWIIKILQKLKKLHKSTSRIYKSNYHNIIVDYRIDNIIYCPILNNILQSINHPIIKNVHNLFNMFFIKKSFQTTKELHIKNLLVEQKYIYNKFLPNKESIIHGDPNLENIIITNDNKIKFIDPRTQWDDKENIDHEGFFDNLYDIAAMVSSIIVNYIISDLQQFQFDKNKILYNQVIEDQIQHYINNHAEKIFNEYFKIDDENYIKEEKIRFMIYLTCSLVGFIRYEKWAININFILYILLLVCYINIYINKL